MRLCHLGVIPRGSRIAAPKIDNRLDAVPGIVVELLRADLSGSVKLAAYDGVEIPAELEELQVCTAENKHRQQANCSRVGETAKAKDGHH